MVYPILRLPRPLSHFSRSICSFRDHQEVIGGYSSPQNKLLKHRYIFKTIWYFRSLGYWEAYIPFHGPFDSLRTLRQSLKVIPHLGIDFRTLSISLSKFGTFLRKFGTSNPWAIETPISLPKVHLFL